MYVICFSISLKIKCLSLKQNVVSLFRGGSFGAGPNKNWKMLMFFFSFWDSAPKVPPKINEQSVN